MTSVDELAQFRSRLYQAYATHHAGFGSSAVAAAIYRRDIAPLLPPRAVGEVLDLGCGQGELVRLLLADGFSASGVDVSPEQVSIAREAGLATVTLGDYRAELRARGGRLAAVTACDFLEHLTKPEVLEAFDCVAAALRPGGVLIARVPNAVSPLGGHIRHGDFTHESWFSGPSVRQLAAVAGFGSVDCRPCPPIAGGLAGNLRILAWKPVSAFFKLALAAETGERSRHIVTQNLTFCARMPPGGAVPRARQES
jgi:2-polyprenyl-3-methyl-5-hydroxy-6-metoxy-1,4-benzoquinol methylase